MNYGALKSIPKNTTINGQPHQLSYIRPDEAELLKSIGGSGQKVNGVPAYFFFGGSTGFGSFGDSVVDSVSSGFQAVSDAGKAAVDFISNAASDVYQGTANVLTPFDDEEYIDGVLTNTTTNLPVTSTGTTSTKTFDEAFAEARGAGSETFTWQGDVYTTDLAPEVIAPDPTNLQNIDAQLEALRSQGFTADDPNIKALLEQKNVELANLGDKLSAGEDQVQAYIDKFGTSYLEDRFLTGRINPATGLPYQPRDTNIVNPLDADTMPYTPGGLDDDEIIYLGGDPYSSTVDGVDIETGPIVSEDGSVVPVEEIDPVVFDDVDSGGVTQIVTKTITPQNFNYATANEGGMWSRFLNSPYSRFGVAPIQTTQTITSVNQSDGSTLYYDQEGNLIDPNTLA
jgi:hypothetical protein|tara:strand:+ start:171 stop:1364 length:1194 start_codon:yes stop_codon:yes gene_type:complete